MLNPLNFISKIFKSSNQKELDNLTKFAAKISDQEANISKLKNQDFTNKTLELKNKLKNNLKLNDLLPEA